MDNEQEQKNQENKPEQVPATEESESGEISAAADEELNELVEIRKRYESDLAELKDALQRERAEFINFRKRAQAEKLAAQSQAAVNLLEKLLPVFDSFDQLFSMQQSAAENAGLEKFFEGAQIIQRQMWGVFSEAGLQEINPMGEEYDAASMEAIGIAEGDVDKETVTAVYQKGYKTEGRVLRPARVMVTRPRSIAETKDEQ